MSEHLDLGALLTNLAVRRPVFHSEADFQFAFAWCIKEAHSDVEIRLENHPERNVRLDVQLNWPDGRFTAIELKYMSRLWSGEVNGESFALKDHGANDIRSYDVLKDVERVERFVGDKPEWDGWIVALTNVASYWNPPNHSRMTNADAFRLHEDREITGSLDWRTIGGTQRQRPKPIVLRGSHRARWSDYSRVDNGPAGTFRYLLTPVTAQTSLL